MAGHCRWEGSDLLLQCHIQPGARRDEFCGLHDGRLKIRVAAPALEDRANRALVKFVAAAFGVSAGAVTVSRGQRQRHKELRITAPRRLPPQALIPPAP